MTESASRAGDHSSGSGRDAELLEVRHQLLRMRDHVIGTEAEVGRLSRDLSLAFAELKRAHRRAERLSQRRDELRVRVDQLRLRLAKSQQEVQRLRQRHDDSQGRPSVARRLARRLRGGDR